MKTPVQTKIKTFFGNYAARSWPAEQIIIQAFDNPQGIYYVESGGIRQYAIDNRGNKVVVNIFHSPAFMPMSWAVNDVDNEYFFETIEPSVLRVAPKEEAIAFIQGNPDVMYDLLARVYSGMDGILMRTVHLMSSSAYARILHELSIQVARMKVKQTKDIHLPLKEYELGTYCGLSRETVSREMKKLKDKKIITITGHDMVIKDHDLLLAELEKLS